MRFIAESGGVGCISHIGCCWAAPLWLFYVADHCCRRCSPDHCRTGRNIPFGARATTKPGRSHFRGRVIKFGSPSRRRRRREIAAALFLRRSHASERARAHARDSFPRAENCWKFFSFFLFHFSFPLLFFPRELPTRAKFSRVKRLPREPES